MARCIIDVKFLFNEKDYIFAKKVLICGITSENKSFVKEFIYPYPTSELEIGKADNKYKIYGNLEFHKIDMELSKALKGFDTIIVDGETEKKFISFYVINEPKIIEIEEQQ